MQKSEGPSRTASTILRARQHSSDLTWRAAIDIPQLDCSVGHTHSDAVESTLTDFYQLSMAYAYWKNGKQDEHSVFDLYFRKCPFNGEFVILAGIEESLRFINTFQYTEEQIAYVRTLLPTAENEFFDYLKKLDCSKVTVYAQAEGTIVFPNLPLMRIEGPLGIIQLLETTLLNLTNYPSLVATNAARHRLAAGANKKLFEFGCRRAQGPDGAMSASKYSYLGGFDGTSNVRAGHLFGIPVVGTHAHAYVTSFSSMNDLKTRSLQGDKVPNFADRVLHFSKALGFLHQNDNLKHVQNIGELAAFTAYAQAFPDGFCCLVDTYDTLGSGVPNFLAVGLALHEAGHKPVGVRLDSGDLAYLSRETRALYKKVAEKFEVPYFKDLVIVASNDINETVLHSLNEEGHEVDSFGIGTNLVTCQAQPALGMVFKLAELNGEPRMKLSQEVSKTSVPARKSVYRLYVSTGEPVVDLVVKASDAPPQPGQRVFARHLFDERKRLYVVPSAVKSLLNCVWSLGKSVGTRPTLEESRSYVQEQLKAFRPDHLRPIHPTPYKVSASAEFYDFFREMWQRTAPIYELK